MAAVKAAYDTLSALRGGTSPADLRERTASSDMMAQVTRRESYDGWIEDFLS